MQRRQLRGPCLIFGGIRFEGIQLRGNDAGPIYDTCEAIARAKCQNR
jgi:hypothetical protein